jgi:iron(III) transport system permease protein
VKALAAIVSLRRRASEAHLEVHVVLLLLLGVGAAALVAAPLVDLVVVAFRKAGASDWTFDNVREAFGTLRYLKAIANTVMLGLAVTALSALFAVPLAWAVSRTDMPCPGLVRVTAFTAFVMPPYLLAVAWILLAGPNAGWLNRLATTLFSRSGGPFNIFSFAGMAVVMAAHLYFFIFTAALNAFDLVSSDMEEAANILGANRRRTFLAVTAPIIAPALLAGAMIVFLQAAALFAVPALISLPAGIPLLTMQIWEFFEYPVRVGVAAAYSLPLVVLTALMLWYQQWLIGRRGFASISGKGGERRLIRLGPWRWPMFGYAVFVGAMSVYLPLLVLFQAAFSKAWGRGVSLANVTLQNFNYVLFEHSASPDALVNSFTFGVLTAILAVGFAFVAAYVIENRLIPFPGILRLLCIVPVAVPGIVLAIGVYAVYGAPPLSLYGTSTILILAFTTRFLPIAFSNIVAGMKSLGGDLELAVRMMGGSRLQSIRYVTVPLLKRSLVGIGILVFVGAAQELSTAILLVGPNTRVLSVVMLGLSEEGNLEALSALGLILLFGMLVVLLVGQRLLGRDFMMRGA